jgi:hypothetical protein
MGYSEVQSRGEHGRLPDSETRLRTVAILQAINMNLLLRYWRNSFLRPPRPNLNCWHTILPRQGSRNRQSTIGITLGKVPSSGPPTWK